MFNTHRRNVVVCVYTYYIRTCILFNSKEEAISIYHESSFLTGDKEILSATSPHDSNYFRVPIILDLSDQAFFFETRK